MMKQLAILFAVVALSITGWADDTATPTTPAAFFQTEKVWSLHFSLTAEQYAALEPAGAQGGPGGRAPQGRGEFNPGSQLAQAFFQAAGKDTAGTFSIQEFSGLAAAWFDTADAEKKGRLAVSSLQEALAAKLGAGQAGGPRPGPGRGIEFNYVRATLEGVGEKLSDAGLRYAGNNTWMSSRNTDKKPFKVNTNKFVKKQKLAGVGEFNLRNNINDASSLQEVLAYQLYREAGVPSPRTAYARVYLTVPGKFSEKYLGLYGVVENIEKAFFEERTGSKAVAIFKPETRDLFAYLGEQWAAYEKIYEPKTKLSSEDTARLIAFAKLVTNGTDAEFTAQLGEYLDIDEVARYFAVTVWTAGLDSILSMGHNYFVVLDGKTKRFQILPWDLDHTFGAWMRGDLETLSIQRPWQGNHRFLERLFANAAFKQAYLGYLTEFQKTIFAPEKISQDVDKLAGAIREAVREESAEKAAYFEKVVAGKNLQEGQGRNAGGEQRGRGGPGNMSGPGIKVFARNRAVSVREQLAGKNVAVAREQNGPGGFGGRRGGERAGGPPQGGPGRERSNPAQVLLNGLDAGRDGVVTRDEFVRVFSGWFARWDADKNGSLTQAEIAAGVEQLLPRDTRRGGGRNEQREPGPNERPGFEGEPPPPFMD